MRTLFPRKHFWILAAVCAADLVAVGAGMGVPVFPILLGFPIGWILPARLVSDAADDRQLLRKCFQAALLPFGVTLSLMIVIWGPVSAMLFDPAADLANFGLPMILYEPRSSFIGWIVLMVCISPVLQLLATLSAAYVRIAWRLPNPSFAERE
jgi:hypothetical protein